MRILFVPFYTNSSVDHCTTYIFAKNFFRSVVEADENAYVYFPVPERNWSASFEELNHDRIEIIRTPFETNFRAASPMLMSEELVALFNDRDGKYFADAVVTTAPATVPILRTRISPQRDKWSVRPVWATFVMFGVGDETPLPEEYRLQQAAGLLSSDMIFFQSASSLNRVMRSNRRLLSGASVKNIIDKTVSSPATSIPIERIQACEKMEKPRDRYVVNYGYAIHNIYYYKEIFEVYDKLFSSGMPLKVLVTTSSQSFVKASQGTTDVFEKRYDKYFTTHYQLTQKQFWKTASEAHAFLFMARDVESSFSVLEQFMLGQVGVLFQSTYAEECTYDGYPFLCHGKRDAIKMLKYVLENYFEKNVQDVLKKQQAYIRKRYDAGRNTLDVYSAIRDRARKFSNRLVPSKEVVSILRREFRKELVVDWARFVAGVRDRSDNGISVEKMTVGLGGRTYWRRAMECAGWIDDCSSGMPRFVNKAVEGKTFGGHFEDGSLPDKLSAEYEI